MSLIDHEETEVYTTGSTAVLSAEDIGNVVTKTNILIESHRNFLAELPQRSIDTAITASSGVTPTPSLEVRYAGPWPWPQAPASPFIPGVLPECSQALSSASSVETASVAALSSSLAIASSTFLQSISSLQTALSSSNTALSSATSAQLSIQASASAAIISANSTASSALAANLIATSSVSSISSSASSAISSIQASAAAVLSSAQSSVSSANSVLSSIQSSANLQAISLNSAVASASAMASAATATATFAIEQARASVSALAAQETAAIAASRLAAMNTTTFALAITFAVLGSSILSILIYYLIVRYRRRRREERQLALKEKISRVRHHSDESQGPSLSDFPMPPPIGRGTWSRVRSLRSMDDRRTWTRAGSDIRDTRSTDTQNQIHGGRKTWATTPNVAISRFPIRPLSTLPSGGMGTGTGRARTWTGNGGSRTITANEMDEDGNTQVDEMRSRGTGRPEMVRKNTLTYDPEHPEQPPKFTSWLEESYRSSSPFPKIGGANKPPPKSKRLSKGSVRSSGIGTAI